MIEEADETVPLVPDLEKVEENLFGKFQVWIKFFKDMSPRIMVIVAGEKKFNPTKFKWFAMRLADEDRYKKVRLHDWPNEEDIFFAVLVNFSPDLSKPKFLTKDVYLFCRKDLAFGLGYFERIEGSDYEYSLFGDTPREAMVWKYIAKLIRNRLEDLQNDIVGDQPPESEKLFED